MRSIIPILAIIAITAIEGYALSRGINGTGLSIALSSIAGIGGWSAKGLADRRKAKLARKNGEGEQQP